jgi:hypothetical protein
MQFIACANRSEPDDPEILEAWELMMHEVSRVYIARPRKAI